MTLSTNNSPDMKLAGLAHQVVNQVFYGTLMREFRGSQRPTLLDNGPGATTFIRQLDMELIKRISPQGSSSLAATLAERLQPNQANPIRTALSDTTATDMQTQGALHGGRHFGNY